MLRNLRWLSFLLLAAAAMLHADSISLTGSLSSSTDTVQHIFDVTSTSQITVQTWGFGGGVNAAGAAIAPGGFDPLVALFSGTGATAAIFNIGGDPNNPAGTSDVLSNFAQLSGCPPAGTLGIGSDQVCGDVTLKVTLDPGTYTLLLSDADFIPNALVQPGATTLGDGFTDFTSGVFQTCDIDSSGNTTCITPSANYAVDITGSALTSPAPEPGTALLLGSGLLVSFGFGRRKRKEAAVDFGDVSETHYKCK